LSLRKYKLYKPIKAQIITKDDILNEYYNTRQMLKHDGASLSGELPDCE